MPSVCSFHAANVTVVIVPPSPSASSTFDTATPLGSATRPSRRFAAAVTADDGQTAPVIASLSFTITCRDDDPGQ
jgi:hypothetical protein